MQTGKEEDLFLIKFTQEVDSEKMGA